MTRRFITLLLFLVASVLTIAPGAFASDITEGISQANDLYEKGDYESAIEGYAAIVEQGVVNADLFYNLGNAYYKVGALGRAVLYYERARRLAPRDADIAHNLSLARSLLRDGQFVSEPGKLRRAVLWIHDHLSASESFMLATLLYVLLSITIILFVFQRTRVVSRFYGRMSVVSPGRLFGFQKRADLALAVGVLLILTSTVVTSAWTKQNAETVRRVAVIVDEEVSVFSGPGDDATLQFKVHEGTLVDVEDARTGWLKIELPGELTGWIRSASAERI